MIPVRMLVENFKALTGPHIIPLREQGIIHVLGQNMASESADSNGSSKTALMISAPCWCFTGRTEESRRVVGGAAVRNRWTKDPVTVEIEFDDDRGDRYTLRRQRTAANIETVKLTGPHGRIWDAKHEIESRLGFDWSFFTNVVVFGPDTSARFSQAVDSERKAVFDRIIPDLERLNRVHERADASLRHALHRCDEIDQSIVTLTARLDEIAHSEQALEQERAQLNMYEFDRWISIMRRQSALRTQRIEQYEHIAHAIARADRMEALRPQAENFIIVCRRLRDLEKEFSEQSVRVMALSSHLMDNLNEAQKLVGEHTCPTCLRKFDKKAAKEIIARAKAKDDATRKKLDAQQAILVHMETDVRQTQDSRDRLEKLAMEFDDFQSKMDMADLRADLDGIERELDKLEGQEKPPAREYTESRAAEIKAQLENVAQEQGIAKDVAGVAEFWVDALKTKLKTRLLDGVEEYLDDRLRYYSSALTAGEIMIGFAAQTKLKKGTMSDKIAITAEHLFGAAELDLHSSGERQRIDLAIILALQDLARQQHGSAVRLSLFDEVFDHLDETGVERLMELMAQEKAERGTVAIVTQNPRISAHPADHQLVVKRTKQGTTVMYDEEEV